MLRLQINNTIINADLETVLSELQRQLAINKIPYLQKTQDSGKDIMVQCPFHGNGQERRPSAGIRKSDGMFHCFACHEVHTLPEVISYVFGKDDMFGQYGTKWLVKNFGTVQIEERKDVEIDVSRSNLTTKNDMVDISDSNKSEWVSEEELDSYRYYHKYWKERGITDDDIIELFDLGYDPKTNEITMPNYNKDGKCVFVARRSIIGKRFSYPKNVEKIVYGIYQLYQLEKFPKEVYITESMIDCIYLWQFGRYACALNGLGTKSQFDELCKMPCREFILATDNDEAGMKARVVLRNNIKNKLITEVVLPTNKKDINECTKEEILNLQEVFCL